MKKADVTRLKILQTAFELIYAKGYQTTSIDDILASTEVTKGAFYYHFKNKDEMGLAIINELMKPTLTENFNKLLNETDNPLESIYKLMHHLLIENDFLKMEFGCPAGNFAHEMAPWNSDFTKTLNEIVQAWMTELANSIEIGKSKGFVKTNTNANQVAIFIIAGYWGIRELGKLENSKEVYWGYLDELKRYLDSL